MLTQSIQALMSIISLPNRISITWCFKQLEARRMLIWKVKLSNHRLDSALEWDRLQRDRTVFCQPSTLTFSSKILTIPITRRQKRCGTNVQQTCNYVLTHSSWTAAGAGGHWAASRSTYRTARSNGDTLCYSRSEYSAHPERSMHLLYHTMTDEG